MTAASLAMSAAAFGPGRGVRMSGTAMGVTLWIDDVDEPALLAFPARAGRRVFEKHAACREVGADGVRGGEVAAAPGGVPLLDEPLDFFDRDRRLLVLRLAQRQDAEHLVEPVERPAND